MNESVRDSVLESVWEFMCEGNVRVGESVLGRVCVGEHVCAGVCVCGREHGRMCQWERLW